jgi:hypothetical protein
MHATIRVTALAGVALLTVDVWLDAASIAWFDTRHLGANGYDLNSKLMPRNSWVTEEGHLSQIAGIVRTTNADAPHANHRIPRSGGRRFGNVDQIDGPGLSELDGMHGV